MKRTLILCALALALTGCQSIADHNAKTRAALADQAAGRAAAAQGKLIAAQVLAQVRGITPQKGATP